MSSNNIIILIKYNNLQSIQIIILVHRTPINKVRETRQIMMVLRISNQEFINKIYVPLQILRLHNFNLDNLQISILHLLHKVILPIIHNIPPVKPFPTETYFPTNLNNNKTMDKIHCYQLIMHSSLQSLLIM